MFTPSALNPDSLPAVQKSKEKGNAAHNVANFATAVSEYTKALSHFSANPNTFYTTLTSWFANPSANQSDDGTSSTSPATKPVPATGGADDATIVLTSLLSNRAASLLALRRFDEAIEDAELVIRLRPNWVKGHFRKGDALLGLGKFNEALEAFRAAQNVDPNGGIINERVAKVQRIMKDLAAGMLIYQWQSGRELCQKSVFSPIQGMIYDYAAQFKNFIYAVGNSTSREVYIMDPCWDIDGILNLCKQENLNILGAIITHYHIDHVGGIPPPPFDQYRVRVDGLVKFLRRVPNVPAYVCPQDIPEIVKSNPEIDVARMVATADGQELLLPTTSSAGVSAERGRGTVLRFIHTPGHTKGSQCLLMNGERLFTGDTLFIGNCGRCDFPDSSVADMTQSLTKLSELPDDVIVFPGHNYGGESTTIRKEKATGMLRPGTLKAWAAEHGHFSL